MAGTCSTNGEKMKAYLQKPKRKATVEMREWFNIIADVKRLLGIHDHLCECDVNLIKTKRRLLYLKTQSVPRSKHFSSRFFITEIMLHRAKVAVGSKINREHINTVRAECAIFNVKLSVHQITSKL